MDRRNFFGMFGLSLFSLYKGEDLINAILKKENVKPVGKYIQRDWTRMEFYLDEIPSQFHCIGEDPDMNEWIYKVIPRDHCYTMKLFVHDNKGIHVVELEIGTIVLGRTCLEPTDSNAYGFTVIGRHFNEGRKTP